MSCCQTTSAEENPHYEDFEFFYNSEKNKIQPISTNIINFKDIIAVIPSNIFDFFTFTVNVFTNEAITLQPCEPMWIKTNVLIEPFLPLTCSIVFQGIINGLSIKSSNHSILPLKEEILKIRIQNFNQNIQSIPIGMPIGRIVVQSKNFWEL